MSGLWLTVALIASALALHPFTGYPLSLALLRRMRGRTMRSIGRTTPPQSVSLLVCAHNEERVIADKMANLKALLDDAPGDAEALVYVDGSSDRTAEIAKAAADDRITVVVSPSRTGKTAGLNRLVRLARGEVLVLSDANVMVEPDALRRLARRLADPAVGLVCGHLRYVDAKSATARNGALYWRLEEAIRQLESDTGSAIGADGSLYAVRRRLWPDVPPDLIDDFYVPMHVRFAGRRVVRAADAVAVERSAEDGGDEFRRKVRIACQAFNVHRRLWPRVRQLGALDLYKYVSHKLLKWLAGIHLAIAGGALVAAAAPVWGWPLALGGLATALLALILGHALRVPPLSTIGDAILMLAAVALGVARSIQGERFQTWQPAASVRAGGAFAGTPSSGSANRPLAG